MRHRMTGKKLNRPSAARTALRRGLITELFRHDTITTTQARASAIRGEAEKLITLARNRGDAAALAELARGNDRPALARRVTPAQADTLLRMVESGAEGLDRACAAIAAHVRRHVARTVYGADVVRRLFDEIAPRYATRNGGYTRTFRLGQRRGDAAPLVKLELVEEDDA